MLFVLFICLYSFRRIFLWDITFFLKKSPTKWLGIDLFDDFFHHLQQLFGGNSLALIG